MREISREDIGEATGPEWDEPQKKNKKEGRRARRSKRRVIRSEREVG